MTQYLDKLLAGATVEWKTLGEVFDIKNGYTPAKSNQEYWKDGTIPWFRMEDIRTNGRILSDSIQHISDAAVKGHLIPKNSLLMSTTATIGEHALILVPYLTNQQITNFSLKASFIERVNIKYLFYCFFDFGKWCIENANKNGGLSIIGLNKLKEYIVPIPPLHVQAEIVRILDTFSELSTKLISELNTELSLRKQQYAYYREQLLSFEEGAVEWKTLGEVADYEQPTKYLVESTNYKDSFLTPVLTAGKTFILGYTDETHGIYRASENPTIIFDDFTTAIKWVDFDFKAKSSAMKMITSQDESKFLLKYIYYWLNTVPSGLVVGDHKRQWIGTYSNLQIPIPPLAEQLRIVSILDQFDALTASISEGLPKEIALRKQQYEYYREQLLSFPKEEAFSD